MIVLLNGAFGIGKTTAARIVQKQLPGCGLVNPERIGWVLQRGAHLVGRHIDDFQDVPFWRTLTILRIRAEARIAKHVIVPMAISNVSYLNEIRSGLDHASLTHRHVCLIAPLAEVHRRLRKRGADDIRDAWQFRRAAECCAVHGDVEFARQVAVGDATAAELAERLLRFFG